MTLFYLRWQGLLAGGERWNTGVHVSGAGTIDDAFAAAGLATGALWLGTGTAATGIATHLAAEVTMSSYVVYQLAASTLKATAKREADTALVGAGATASLPQEVAEVASLRTAGVGPSFRGRMYLPPTLAATVLTSGRLDSIVAGDLAASVAGALGVLLGASFTPVLASVGHADRPITSVDVGDVFDAQRRRRDKLLETRTSVDVVAL